MIKDQDIKKPKVLKSLKSAQTLIFEKLVFNEEGAAEQIEVWSLDFNPLPMEFRPTNCPKAGGVLDFGVIG